MAMNVGPSGDEDEVLNAINTTPLVDVMLVLLIIFLITIPVVTTSIQLQLPKEKVEERQSKPENVVISVDVKGDIFWYDAKMVSTKSPQPEVHIRGDMASRYNSVGKVIYACQRAGITKVSFITDPQN